MDNLEVLKSRRNTMLWRVPMCAAIAMSLFWIFWYFVIGKVPEVSEIYFSKEIVFQLWFPVSRWFDIIGIVYFAVIGVVIWYYKNKNRYFFDTIVFPAVVIATIIAVVLAIDATVLAIVVTIAITFVVVSVIVGVLAIVIAVVAIVIAVVVYDDEKRHKEGVLFLCLFDFTLGVYIGFGIGSVYGFLIGAVLSILLSIVYVIISVVVFSVLRFLKHVSFISFIKFVLNWIFARNELK